MFWPQEVSRQKASEILSTSIIILPGRTSAAVLSGWSLAWQQHYPKLADLGGDQCSVWVLPVGYLHVSCCVTSGPPRS